MKIEIINNKQVMNIGLINVNYKLDTQSETLKGIADTLLYFDNDELPEILSYIRNCDTLYITSYAFINDDSFKAIKFKDELDNRGIPIESIMDKTVGYDRSWKTLTFGILVNMYESYKFIVENRIK
jgi:hypothetical protein